MLCLQPAKEGGLSSFSSSVSVHNELLRRGRQDLVEELAKDQWYLDRKNEIPEGKLPYYRLPIFNYHQVQPLQVSWKGMEAIKLMTQHEPL